jgi:isoleucyl-tRNA synthetase
VNRSDANSWSYSENRKLNTENLSPALSISATTQPPTHRCLTPTSTCAWRRLRRLCDWDTSCERNLNLRVRQPLAELRFASSNAETAAAIEKLGDVIGEELNIQKVIRQDNLDSLVKYAYKPNLKTLGPKYGKLLNALRTKLPELGDAVLAPLRRGQNLTVELEGQSVDLTPDDVLVSTEQAAEWVCSDDSGIQVAISTC